MSRGKPSIVFTTRLGAKSTEDDLPAAISFQADGSGQVVFIVVSI
jgi:hypothetical protein